MRAVEDWALAVTFVFALAFVVTIHEASHFQASAATEMASSTPRYEMTVTAKRLPSSCKGIALVSNASCAKIVQGDAVVEMHEVAPAYAAR
jgi:hypothetical protein